MRIKKIPALFAVCSVLLGLQAVGQFAENDHDRRSMTANRSWLPGAMVEVVVVEPLLKENEDDRPQVVDLVVEIQQVFTGPKSLRGTRILINPSLAHRFPPDRWSALHMHGIHGAPRAAFPAGKRGLLWIFQRRELPTGRSGREFSFFTGFQPMWERSNSDNPSNEEFYRQAWKNTRAMMQVLGELEGLDTTRMKQAVLELIGHENDKVRKWAIAALVRVKGARAIADLNSLEPPAEAAADIQNFIRGTGISSACEPLIGAEKRSVPGISLLGVEVLTEAKSEGGHTLFSTPRVIEQGTVKVLRVFSGSNFAEGEIVSVGNFSAKAGEKFLVFPRDERISIGFPTNTTTFPPEGPWDGGTTRLAYSLEPEIDLTSLEPWFKKLSSNPPPHADEFLEDALRNAPSLVATWALRRFLDDLRPETLEWLRVTSGLSKAGSAPTSMREMFLYEQAMHYLYGKLWLWSAERIDLFEQIFSYPLSDWEDAWLLQILNNYEGFQPVVASADEWKRLSHAVRHNASWRENWLDPDRQRGLDMLAWSTVQTEALATLDATTSIDYLIDRWAIPDQGERTASGFVESRGSMLAHTIPLRDEEVERLREALAQRLTTSDEPPPPEEVEKRIKEIQARTWDEILAQPFP